jgi:hypothetical protein
MKRKRTELELKNARQYVKYELKMLNAGVEAKLKHLRLPNRKRNKYIGSIYLDSILLHIRNLFEFLNRKSKDDYIRAIDFFDNTSWKPTKFKIINHKLIKEIEIYRSHLSFNRMIADKKPKWELKRMRDEIFEVFNEFVSQLPISERANWKILTKKYL